MLCALLPDTTMTISMGSTTLMEGAWAGWLDGNYSMDTRLSSTAAETGSAASSYGLKMLGVHATGAHMLFY